MDLNISNEKLLEFDKEAIEEYKQKLLNEIAFSDLGEETRFIVRQLNKCNFLLTDPKARESSAKISEFIDSISTIITNNNSMVSKAEADKILEIHAKLNALEKIDAVKILYDGVLKHANWMRNLAKIEPKFKDIIKKALLVKSFMR